LKWAKFFVWDGIGKIKDGSFGKTIFLTQSFLLTLLTFRKKANEFASRRLKIELHQINLLVLFLLA